MIVIATETSTPRSLRISHAKLREEGILYWDEVINAPHPRAKNIKARQKSVRLYSRAVPVRVATTRRVLFLIR